MRPFAFPLSACLPEQLARAPRRPGPPETEFIIVSVKLGRVVLFVFVWVNFLYVIETYTNPFVVIQNLGFPSLPSILIYQSFYCHPKFGLPFIAINSNFQSLICHYCYTVVKLLLDNNTPECFFSLRSLLCHWTKEQHNIIILLNNSNSLLHDARTKQNI